MSIYTAPRIKLLICRIYASQIAQLYCRRIFPLVQDIFFGELSWLIELFNMVLSPLNDCLVKTRFYAGTKKIEL
jgi:hypothetical protein